MSGLDDASEAAAALSTDPVRAGDPRLAAWRAFLRAHNHLMRRLAADLSDAGKIDLQTYDVLVQLRWAPGARLRMADLADAVLLSRSGLTRMIDRMEREGLVRREPDPQDRRGTYTVLTDAGRDALREASPVHLAGVNELVLNRLSPDELATLQKLMTRIDPAPDAGI